MRQKPKPVGSRYGMLSVLRYDSPHGWLVRCDCGTERHFGGYHLRSLQYMSCGCSRYKRHRDLMRQRHEKAKAAKLATVNVKLQVLHGTRCWCCRNHTGIEDTVALCHECRGAA